MSPIRSTPLIAPFGTESIIEVPFVRTTSLPAISSGGVTSMFRFCLHFVVALVLVRLTGKPIVDTVISIGIALFMLRSSVTVVREGFDVVMDKSLEPEVVAKVEALLRASPGIQSFHDLKTRRGKIPHVDLHVVVAPETTTQAVHDTFLALQSSIRAVVGASTRVLMHADPAEHGR